MPHQTLAITALTLFAVAAPVRSATATETVNPRDAVPLLVRALPYDRSFANRGYGDFVIAVVCSRNQRGCDDLVSILNQSRISGLRNRVLRFARITSADAASLDATVQALGAHAVLGLERMPKADFAAMLQVAEANQIYAMSLDPEHALESVLGVIRQDSGYKLVVNLRQAREVGVGFDSALLRLCHVVQ